MKIDIYFKKQFIRGSTTIQGNICIKSQLRKN